MKQLRIVFLFLIIGCQSPNRFSKEALNEKFVSIAKQDVTFQNILLKHQGKKILIDIWASWCRDCVVTLPELKKLQQENPTVHFVFLSLDKSKERWMKAIDRLKIKGDHYYMAEGKKGAF